jgi:hypothetical protein
LAIVSHHIAGRETSIPGRSRPAGRLNGNGGGLYNAGIASFTGITVNFISNQANGGIGVNGGNSGSGAGGSGGASHNGGTGPQGGNSESGAGGLGGDGGLGMGGGIFNANTGALTIKPRQGAKKGSKQAKATDVITANLANRAHGGVGGLSSTASTGGPGGGPNGTTGFGSVGLPGVDGSAGFGQGGGIATKGTATIDNTTITGNTASNDDNDVNGMLAI